MPQYPDNRTILVSHHVALQLRDRTRDQRPVRELIDRIEEWVRCGIESGQVMNHKPPSFRLYRETNRNLPEGHRFIWCGDSPRFGFIVERRADGVDLVKTAIVRVQAEAA